MAIRTRRVVAMTAVVPPSVLWFVAQDGARRGACSGAELQARLDSRDVSRQSVVWRSGLARWEPILDHFIDPLQAAQAAHSAGEPARRFLWIGACLSLLASLATLGVSLDLPLIRRWTGDGEPELPLELAVFILAATLVSAVLWGWLARTRSRAPAIAGGWLLVKVLCLMAPILVLPDLLFLSFLPADVARSKAASDAMRQYQAKLDETGHRLNLSGPIGPGYAALVTDQLALHPEINTVAITSPGGLIREAMAAAEAIATHRPGLDTQAVESCKGACILLFMAGRHGSADLSFSVGGQAIGLNLFYQEDIDQRQDLIRQAEVFLDQHGLPQDAIAAANLSGNGYARAVSVIALQAAGVVPHVLYKGAEIEAPAARQYVVASTLQTVWRADALVPLAAEIARSGSPPLRSAADKVYQRVADQDVQVLASAVASLAKPTVKAVAMTASPAAFYAFLRAKRALAGRFADAKDWGSCHSAIDDVEPVFDAPADLYKAKIAALAEAVASAAANHWVARPIPANGPDPLDEVRSWKRSQPKVANVVEPGHYPSDSELCVWGLVKLDAVLDRSPDAAVALYARLTLPNPG